MYLFNFIFQRRLSVYALLIASRLSRVIFEFESSVHKFQYLTTLNEKIFVWTSIFYITSILLNIFACENFPMKKANAYENIIVENDKFKHIVMVFSRWTSSHCQIQYSIIHYDKIFSPLNIWIIAIIIWLCVQEGKDEKRIKFVRVKVRHGSF